MRVLAGFLIDHKEDTYEFVGREEQPMPATGVPIRADPDLAFVCTGATNFTDGQINRDPNNVIVVQDKSLAIAFQLEFNEMFGSAGAQPDAGKSKFGPDKKDNTPHQFIVND